MRKKQGTIRSPRGHKRVQRKLSRKEQEILRNIIDCQGTQRSTKEYAKKSRITKGTCYGMQGACQGMPKKAMNCQRALQNV